MMIKSRADRWREPTSLSRTSMLGLRSQEARLELLRDLRRMGYTVRMHAYEYIIGDGKKFLSIVMLEPWWGRAVILDLSNDPQFFDLVVSAIKQYEPNMKIVRVKRHEKMQVL